MCIVFYVQFRVRNDLAGRLGVETSPRSLGFSIFFSDFLVIFGYSLVLNVLTGKLKLLKLFQFILSHSITHFNRKADISEVPATGGKSRRKSNS